MPRITITNHEHRVTIRFRRREYRIVAAAAARQGEPVAVFARAVLVRNSALVLNQPALEPERRRDMAPDAEDA